MFRAASLRDTSALMSSDENPGPKSPLQAAREPLSLRFLLAFSASTVLTAAVAVPMAFQAHLAREERDAPTLDRPSVLGTTTVSVPESISSDGLVVRMGDEGPFSLDGAELSGQFDLLVELPGVVRVDWALDDEPVQTDLDEPWRLDDPASGTARPITAGDHLVTATITFEDGRVELRQAAFVVIAG